MSQAMTSLRTACVVLGTDGLVRSANSPFMQIWRFAISDEVVGRPFGDFLAEPADADRLVTETLRDSEWHGRLSARLVDGEDCPIDVSTMLMCDESGEASGVVVTVTEAVDPDRALIERDSYRNMFDALYEVSPDPIYVVDQDARICKANSAAARMHKCTPAELVGRNIAELDDPASADKVSERMARCLAGEKLNFEVRHQLPDGTEVPLEVFVAPFDYCGQRRAIGIDRDISTRRTAEQIIRKSAERPRLALASAKHGVWDLHIPSDKTQVSDEYAEILGYDPEGFEETNARFLERLHPDDHEQTMGTYQDYLEGRIDSFRVEFRQRTCSGMWIWVQSKGRIVERDSVGNPVRIIGTITDISEVKAAQDRLNQLRQHLERIGRISLAGGLAAAVSHELNQPLCAMSNYLLSALHALDETPPRIERAREDVQYANAATHRAAGIIRRFKNLYTEHPPDTQACNLSDLIEQGLELIRDEASRAQVRVRLQPSPSAPLVSVDPILIQQVIINLARNAVEAMIHVPLPRRELCISLDAEDDGAAVLIRVKDKGAGLQQNVIDHLFEAHNSTKNERLGMGLSICRLIVRAHGGEIRLEETSGQGTTFLVKLPVSPHFKHQYGFEI